MHIKLGDEQLHGYLFTSQLFELGNAPNTNDLLSVFGNPKGNRISPIPISAECPISSVAKPIAKTFIFHIIWNPVGLCISF